MVCLTRENVQSKKRAQVRHDIDADRYVMLHSLSAEKFIKLSEEAIVGDQMDKGVFLVGMVRECSHDEEGHKLFETSQEVGDTFEPLEVIEIGSHAIEVSGIAMPDTKKNSPPGNSWPSG